MKSRNNQDNDFRVANVEKASVYMFLRQGKGMYVIGVIETRPLEIFCRGYIPAFKL